MNPKGMKGNMKLAHSLLAVPDVSGPFAILVAPENLRSCQSRCLDINFGP